MNGLKTSVSVLQVFGEGYRIRSERFMDEYYSLIEKMKPKTREDFARFLTTFIIG